MGVCVLKQGQVVTTTFGESRPNPSSKEGGSDAESRSGCCEDPIFPVINVDPPANFHPDILVSEEELICRKKVQNLKTRPEFPENLVQLWEESGFLSVIHNHVLSISSANLTSIRDLAQALTRNTSKYMRELNDKFGRAVAKAYAIYFWITNNVQYDTEKWESVYDGSLSAFDTRKASPSDYASLFNALCAEAGLNAQKIEGNLRKWRSLAAGYSVFSPEKHNFHCWNVVNIEDRPLLIDCTLGSGYTTSSFEFVKLYSRHYFMAPPQNLILTHWPSDSSQQFLQPPLSLQDLQPIIPIPTEAQSAGLLPFNWSEIIEVTKESLDPVVSVSFSLSNTTSYVTAKLAAQSCSKDAGDSLRYHTFVNKVDASEFNIQAVLPTCGKFILNIYLNDMQENPSRNLSLSYIIECDVCHDVEVGYPSAYPLPARAFNFAPKYWNGKRSYCCVNSRSALFSLVFEASSDVAFYHCLIRGKTIGPSQSLHSDIYHHQTLLINNKNRYKLLATFPDEGWWTVYIAGTKTSVGVTSGYTSLLTYHVLAEEGSMKMSYPQILMPGVVFFSTNPISASDNKLTTVCFTSLNLLNFHHYLTEQADGKIQKGCSNIELLDENDQAHANYVLNLVFPTAGTWFVHVYSTQSDGENKALFKLKLYVDSPTPNRFLIESNALLLREYEMNLVNNGIVIFPDDGQPLSLEFEHHSDGVDFIHELKSPQNMPVDYCTFLAQQPTAPSTLSAVFPSPGKWTVELFARKAGTNEAPDLVLQIQLEVKVPVLGYCYPKIYPAFSEFGCRFSKGDALLKSSCSGGEFKLPFQTLSRLYFFFKVENESAGSIKDFSQQAFVHISSDSENQVLHLVFPECGRWKLSMYAKRLQQPTEQAVNAAQVLEVSLQNDMCTHNATFPLLFYEAFLEPFKLHFNPEDVPLPLLIQTSKPPTRFSINYYSPPDIQFMHYAEVRANNEQTPDASDEVIEHIQTRMMSSNTGLHQLQV